MVQGSSDAHDGSCRHCGSPLRVNAPFCATCGQAVTNRGYQHPNPAPRVLPELPAYTAPSTVDHVVGAGRGVRCVSYLLDLAVMLSPALPLAIAGAVLGVAQIVYTVVPVAFVAVWLWMQIWQGLTGMTFGKSMLGLRLVRAGDNQAPGLLACLTRGAVFGVSAGLAALPTVINEMPCDGFHDRASGLTVIDVVQGANPLGKKQVPVFRRTADRGLNKVTGPLPRDVSGRA
ncbi:RDD family protein [Mycobacterium sp. SMC-4]|nr:RDD family protein [Mycobacterium sp. SMC-4]